MASAHQNRDEGLVYSLQRLTSAKTRMDLDEHDPAGRKGGAKMSVRVLMVDDSVLVRDILRHHLECIGCAVIAESENTSQALDLFRTVAPTLVTLDVAVPQAGGIGALALFRIMRRENPGLSILVVSASAYPEIRQAFLREGALDYIVKPFDAETFARVRNRLVGLFPELIRPAIDVRPADVAIGGA